MTAADDPNWKQRRAGDSVPDEVPGGRDGTIATIVMPSEKPGGRMSPGRLTTMSVAQSFADQAHIAPLV